MVDACYPEGRYLLKTVGEGRSLKVYLRLFVSTMQGVGLHDQEQNRYGSMHERISQEHARRVLPKAD